MEDSDKILNAVNAIALEADAHESDCPHHYDDAGEAVKCWDNRCFIMGLLMNRLGLSLTDLGFIADAFLALEAEMICDTRHMDDVDDVLEAKTIG